MRIKVVLPTVVLVAVLAFFAGNGCSFGAKWFSRGNPAVAAMKQMPMGAASFSYWSVGIMRGEDTTLYPIYDKFTPAAVVQQLQDLGIMRKNIDYAARVTFSGQTEAVVLGVNYNMLSLRFKLESLGWARTMHQDVEVWAPQAGQSSFKPMGLKRGVLIVGSTVERVEACIDAVRGRQTPNLYEDQTVRAVVDNLPPGIITRVFDGGEFQDTRAHGEAYEVLETDRIAITAIYSFEDNPAASKYVAAVQNKLVQAGFSEVTVERRDNVILANGVTTMTNFVKGLYW